MKFNEKADQKEALLQGAVEERFGAAVADAVVGRFVAVQAPEAQVGAREFRKITMGPGGAGGGSTIKPGNVTLQLRALLEAVSMGAFAGVSVAQTPWLLPFALLTTMFAFARGATVVLTERDTAILWAIHVAQAETGAVSEARLADVVNEELTKHGRPKMNAESVAKGIARLMRLKCIEYAQSVVGQLRLCETVKINYGLQ